MFFAVFRTFSTLLAIELLFSIGGLVNAQEELPFATKPDLRDLGLELIEGDIAVPRGMHRKGNRPTILPLGQRWTDKVVPYKYHTSVDDSYKATIRAGLDHWEENSCLAFKEMEDTSRTTHHIRFRTDKPGCWSLIGRTIGIHTIQNVIEGDMTGVTMMSYQDINLQVPGCMRVGTVVHEIGHAVGFYHEQSRSDRDDHIHVLYENMEPAMRGQFEKADDDNFTVGYDLESVMQYPSYAFSKDVFELNTIVTKDPLMQLRLGGEELTFRDRKLANAMYGCDAGCSNRDSLKCENGGFLYARYAQNTPCKCTCPPNTSGDQCEIVQQDNYYEPPKCGGNYTTAGPIETANSDQSCVYWIQAPQGQKVSLKFEQFAYPSRRETREGTMRCRGGRLEVRLDDIVHGKMFCGDELAGKELKSSSGDVILVSSKLPSNGTSGFRAVVSFE